MNFLSYEGDLRLKFQGQLCVLMSLTTLFNDLKTGERGYDPSKLCNFCRTQAGEKLGGLYASYQVSTIWVNSVPCKVHIVLAVLDPLKEKRNEGLWGVLLLFLLNNSGLI